MNTESLDTSAGDDLDLEIQRDLNEEKLSKRKRRARRDPIYDGMMKNVQKFSIMIVVMALVLGVTTLIVVQSWQHQEQTRVSEQETTAGPIISTDAEIVLMNPPSGTGNRNIQTQFKTETLSKAMALIKRADNMAENNRPSDAVELYKEALEKWPYLTDGWKKLGRLYLDLEQFQKAEIALERALENEYKAEIQNDLGVSLLFQKKLNEALDLFDTVIRNDPEYAPSYFNQALCHIANHDPASARDSLNRYLKLKPNDPKALKELAFIYASGGNYSEAYKSLKQALKEAPEWPPLYFDAAATAALLGRADDALKYLDKAEVLSSSKMVWQIYQQPTFRDIRLTVDGKNFEHELAQRARDTISSAAVENAEGAPTAPTRGTETNL